MASFELRHLPVPWEGRCSNELAFLVVFVEGVFVLLGSELAVLVEFVLSEARFWFYGS